MAFLRSALWDGRKHYLDRMTVPDLVRAYFAFPAIQGYLGLGVLSTVAAIYYWPGFLAALAAVVVTIFIYGLVWYVLHRFVLHGRYLYKSPLTASVWKRIHFDHHGDPNAVSYTHLTLPTTPYV